MGAVTPLGVGVAKFWHALLEGQSGVGLITKFDCSDISTKIAAEVLDFNAETYIERKEARRMDRFTQFAYAAAKMAYEESGLTITDEIAPRVGTMIGSGIGESKRSRTKLKRCSTREWVKSAPSSSR